MTEVQKRAVAAMHTPAARAKALKTLRKTMARRKREAQDGLSRPMRIPLAAIASKPTKLVSGKYLKPKSAPREVNWDVVAKLILALARAA